MNNPSFSKYFLFNNFIYNRFHHNDNSHGVEKHFIGYIKEGNAKIVSETTTLKLKKGDMFYIPRGLKYHSYWDTEGIPTHIISIGFTYFPSECTSGYELGTIPLNPRISDLLMYFASVRRINCESIATLYSLINLTEGFLTKRKDSKYDIITDALMSLMDNDPHKKMDDYANELGISISMLYKYTKKSLNKSPNRLRQEIICQKAINLLETSSYSVEEICSICRFSSTSYFRKVLFSVTQKTPTQIKMGAGNI